MLSGGGVLEDKVTEKNVNHKGALIDMMGLKPAFAIAAATMFLAGCGGKELQRAEGLKPSGSEFSKNLYSGYIGLSKSEYDRRS